MLTTGKGLRHLKDGRVGIGQPELTEDTNSNQSKVLLGERENYSRVKIKLQFTKISNVFLEALKTYGETTDKTKVPQPPRSGGNKRGEVGILSDCQEQRFHHNNRNSRDPENLRLGGGASEKREDVTWTRENNRPTSVFTIRS